MTIDSRGLEVLVGKSRGVGLAVSLMAAAVMSLSAVGTVFLVASSGSSASATNTPVPGTAAQVAAAVKSSTSIKSIPSDLTPSLQSFENSTEAYELSGPAYFGSCDAYDHTKEQDHPTPCLFGDTQSTKTVVLVGDSNVGNWAPGLDIGLKGAGYRLAVFGFAGCLTPDVSYSSLPGSTVPAAECRRWHAALPSAIRSLHPLAVIAVSGATALASFTKRQWIAGFEKLYSEIATKATVRVLMGTSPLFPEAIPACLAAHPDPQTCALHYKFGTWWYGEYIATDLQIASASHAKLVPTYQWFCNSGMCSPIISKYLAYADVDHLTIAYGEYLATVVTDGLLKVIKGH